MSYKKYLEYKNNIKVKINLENYELHVRSLIENKAKEGCRLKEVICKEQINNLAETNFYPRAESLRISVSRDFKDIEKHLEYAKELNELVGSDEYKNLVNILETASIAYHLPISEEDVEDLVKSHKEHYTKKLEALANNVETSLKKIKWKNHLVEIVGVPEDNRLEIEKVILKVNEKNSIIFDIKNKKSQVLDDSAYYTESMQLIDQMNKKQEKYISKFYIESSARNNMLLEKAKKEISMGMKGYLQEGTILKKKPSENCWVLKIECDNLILKEDECTIGEGGARINFLEKT